MIVARRAAISSFGPDRPERVDVADLRVAAGHEAPREDIADLERRVQRRRRGESQRDLLRPDPRPAGRPAGQQRQPAEIEPGHRHPVPEPVARSAERGGEPGLRQDEPELEGARRATWRPVPPAPPLRQPPTTLDSTSPSTSSDPNARWSRAVWRSIIAIARAWPVAPSSADRMTAARNGSDRIASIVHAGRIPR